MHRPLLAARRKACFQGAQQAFGQMLGDGGSQSNQSSPWAIQPISGGFRRPRNPTVPIPRGCPEYVSRTTGGVPLVVHRRRLAVFNVRPAADYQVNCIPCAQSLRHQIKQQRPQVRIGHVLRGYGADAGAGMGTAGATAIDEVVIATPKAPDLAQRPAIEKVIASIRNDGGDFNFHDPFRARKRGNDKPG